MEAGYIPVGGGNAGGAGVGGGACVVAPPSGTVIRAPGLKRGKMEEAISDRIKLETVLGLTVGSNAALDCDPATELVAYPAGCTVVLYNPRKNRQTHVLNASRKSVTCVAFSADGRYLATGECGHAPAVRVWDLHDPTAAAAAVQVAEFPSHTHGVCCVAFSMSSKYLVSVGSQHDMIVNVWDWKTNLKLASNKVSSRVKAVSFAENGSYFVTVGFRHVKFWYLEYSRNAKYKEPVPLMGRSAILGEQKDNEFCDVRCGRGAAADSTYAITRGGLLCEFNSRRLLDKWVELRTTSANCMAIGENYIFVGCADGIVRCFSPSTLQFVTTLPRTHYLGVDVSQGYDIRHMLSKPPNPRYPDAVAVTYDEINHKLTCIYNDHSLYVWDVRDIRKIGKSHSALYHSACIWGVDMVTAETSPLPPGCFLTCSSDDTVRYWSLKPAQGGQFAPNIYSNELQKVIYIDPDLKFLKDVDLTAPNEKDKTKSYDDKTGVRCVCVSPDGQHIASGDRAGNVWVHSAARGKLLHTLEAHDAEVLCLEYSPGRPHLLASASRDRLIHVFRVDAGYQIMQTLDDHSSSITAVRFISSAGSLQMVSCGADKTILFRQLVMGQDGGYQFARGANVSGRSTLYDMEVDAGGRHVLAACQDRNVRVYSAQHQRHTKTFRGTVADEGTLIKVSLDSSGIYLATSSTDKLLSVYDYYSGECMATMFGHSEIVTGLRFTPDCQHLISASGDGCIFVWRVPHDMVVTMRARLAQQAIRQGRKVGGATNGLSGLDSETDSHFGSPPREIPSDGRKMAAPHVPDYTLRIGHLPSWAKKSLGDELHATPGGGGGAGGAGGASAPAPEPPARGKWARRLNAPRDDKRDSDGSKDSSLDSGTDTRYVDKRKDTIVKQQRPKSLNISQLSNVEALFRNFDATMKKTYDLLTISPRIEKVTIVTKPRPPELRIRHHTDDSSLGSFKYEDQESTEHDGDVEDISDGERTSSEHNANRKTYYPGNNNDITPGEFTVNAMDVEELRASQRRSKRWKQDKSRLELPLASVATTSVSGSGQDSSEDDEVSTPSGDNAERNPLTGSYESIDTAVRREKFLKSAYDSLSGAEIDSSITAGNTSLSSQHILSVRSPPAKPAPAPRSSPTVDPETARKREELNRRIRETRRQLASYSEQCGLKSSQSTIDLSYIPEKGPNAPPIPQNRNRPVSMVVPINSRPYGDFDNTHYVCPDEPLDSLNSNNFFDSLNYCQNPNLDYRNKNPYAIPANLNHRLIPEYGGNYLDNSIGPYVPPHSNIQTSNQTDRRLMNYTQYQNKPMVFKEQMGQPKVSQNLAFTIDISKGNKTTSKVFNRLFPTNTLVNPETKKEPPPVAPRNFQLNLTNTPDDPGKSQKVQKPNSFRSIFKNYKSCPVSPVSEECKWADKIAKQNTIDVAAQSNEQKNMTDPKKRNSLSFFIGLDGKSLQDNGKSIVDTIKSDTEKMIAEITKKYGDLDDYDPIKSQTDDLDIHPTKETNVEKEDGNFSSDSLEDCSLSQDASCKNKLYSKKVCRKHTKTAGLPRRSISNYEMCTHESKPIVPAKPSFITNQKSSTLPRNMPSNLDDIMDEDYNTNPSASMYRCQSVLTKRCITRSNESILSDNSNGSSVSNEIFMKYGNQSGFQQTKCYDSQYNINDSQNCSFENLNDPDQQYLDRHRHSSASFFLNQRKYMKSSCSQESVLSDEMFLNNENQVLSRTNCNSLESVLSDESECTKSAPLEMLFEGTKIKLPRQNTHDPSVGIPRNSKSCYEFDNTSKSYGSSPNNAPFGGYMYNNYMGQSISPKYNETPVQYTQIVNTPSNKVYGFDIPPPITGTDVAATHPNKTISRSRSLYDSSTKTPPSKNIAFFIDGNDMKAKTDKKQSDEIPRLGKVDQKAKTSKSLQPNFADKFKYVSQMEGCDKSMVKSKSCSFEVVLEPASKPNPLKSLKEKRSHVQKNLEKFEEQIRKNSQNKLSKNQTNKENKGSSANSKYNNNTKSLERTSASKNGNIKIAMDFVPHKPPKPVKRTSSVKLNNRYKSSIEKSAVGSTISSLYKAKLDGLHDKTFLGTSKSRKDDNSNKLEDTSDGTERTFDVFVKEKDINENRSEIQMDSLEVLADQRMERLKQVSLDSLDVLEDNNDNFARDSLDYYNANENRFANTKYKKDNMNAVLRRNDKDSEPQSSCKPSNIMNDNIALTAELEEEIKKFKYIERKIEIINKLVEMEERKILQEKCLKEWRMRPLEANINNGKGVVKVLSRKFEKLATNQTANFTSLTLEEADTDVEQNSEMKEIKRNLSLPDILDSDQIGGLVTATGDFTSDSKNDSDIDNFKKESENTNTESYLHKEEEKLEEAALNNAPQNSETVKNVQKCLQQRVYNVMVIPKTDIHIDSENYESSTTSSSCTNSPKRLTMYGKSKTMLRRPLIRGNIPRPCNTGPENRYCPSMYKVGPVISGVGPGFRYPCFGAGSALARRLQMQPPISKFTPLSANRHLSPGSYQDEDSSGMRRAISLSDLAVKPSPAPRTQVPVTGKLASTANSAVGSGASKPARPPTRYGSKTNMTRSSSVGVLNQSDSESDGQPAAKPATARGAAAGLMRPTISSQNKAAAAAARRRGLQAAYSSVNLTSAGREDSSSEAEGAAGGGGGKPAVPPRPRAVSIDHTARRMGRSGSDRDLSAKAREVTARLTAAPRPGRQDSRSEQSPPEAQLSSTALCSALTEQLTRTAGKVVQLYRSLQRAPPQAADTDDNRQLISGLEAAILETQKVLRGAIQRQNSGSGAAGASNGRMNGADALSSLSSTEGDSRSRNLANVENARDKLEELLSKGVPNMTEMEQFSDVLLTLMQSKMVNTFAQNSPQSLPNPGVRDPSHQS